MPVDVDHKRYFDLSETPLLVVDTDFRVIAGNPAYAEPAGRPAVDLLGEDVLSPHPDSPDRALIHYLANSGMDPASIAAAASREILFVSFT